MINLVAAAFVLAYFAFTIWHCRGLRFRTRDIAYASMAVALSIMLTYFRIPLPIGTAITFDVLPLMLLALLYDHRLVLVAGLAGGVLAGLICPGWEPIHWAQIPLEQLLCFSALGYTGVFGREKRSHILGGVLITTALLLTAHTLSGAVFYGQFAWEGWSPWLYSLVYNATYVLPDCLLSGLLLMALPLDTLAKTINGRNHT